MLTPKVTPPFVVVASCAKDEFHGWNITSYTFQVIGGVHQLQAIMQINVMEKKMYSRRCAVYGSGLSQNAILWLGNQYNEVNKMQQATSFPEVANTCRRLMFVHFDEGMEDDGKQMLVVPRYNTQKYRAWKTECTTYLTSPATVRLYLCPFASIMVYLIFQSSAFIETVCKWLYSLHQSTT